MKISDVFTYSFNAIKLRKLRSGLTILGLVIGIAAIVALVSFTQGLQNTIITQLETGLSTDTIIVIPQSGLGGSDSGFKLLVNDTTAINGLTPQIETSAAVIQRTTYIPSPRHQGLAVNIVGVDFEKIATIYDTTFEAEAGTINLNPQNEIVIIGKHVSKPWENGTVLYNVGSHIEIVWTNSTARPPENKTYIGFVAAVLKEVGDVPSGQNANSTSMSQAQSLFGTFFNSFSPGRLISDSSIYIPISQAKNFFGTEECNQIVVKLSDSNQTTIDNVSKKISDSFNGEVTIISSRAVLNSLSSVFSVIQLFLGGIAVIALIVAGIGIMNIMIVSLIERTQEIGLLKALGMKNHTVLSIFLGESVIISLIGTPTGIVLGWGLANVIAIVFSGSTLIPSLSLMTIAGALAFGVSASVLFTLYPAWRASKLKPVEALRYG
jgi:putative ABC transport system permease protein